MDADDLLVGAAGVREDRHLARQDGEEVVALVAVPEEKLAFVDRPPLAAFLERGQGVVMQPRERALAVPGLLEERQRGRLAHGSNATRRRRSVREINSPQRPVPR